MVLTASAGYLSLLDPGLLVIAVLDLLLDGGLGLLDEAAILEQEGQLLQGAAAGLGVEHEDDAQLKEDPAAVDGQVLPGDGGEGNRVDVGGEEAAELAEDLLDTDTAAAVRVGPQLDEVRVGE